jgi:alpha-methylacyl-CoA racemase
MPREIGANMLDGGAPYYQAYETADGKFLAVGAIENRFYAKLLKGLGIEPSTLPDQNDMARWPEITARFTEIFRTKTREAWAAVFEGTDACVAPILDLEEVGEHPHNRVRELLLTLDGVTQPAPAPRLSRTPGKVEKAGYPRGSHTREILEELGYSGEAIERFHEQAVVECGQSCAT